MKPVLTQCVTALSTLVFAFGGYWWWYNQITLESSRAASLLQEIETETETAERTSTIEMALAKLASSHDEVQNYFISENNIVSFLGDLEKIGVAIGTRVQVGSVGAQSGKDGEQSLPVSLTISGGFNAILRTVGAIEHMPYAVTISSLTMNQATFGWSATMGLTVGSAISVVRAASTNAPAGATSTPKTNGIAPL